MDIWMRSQDCCNRGWGSDALKTLMQRLLREFELHSFIIRPSARNKSAVAAYKKAGFEIHDMSAEEQARRFGEGDYPDSVVMIKHIQPDRANLIKDANGRA